MDGANIGFLVSGITIGITAVKFFSREKERAISLERSRTERWRSEWERVSMEMAELRGRTQDGDSSPPAPLSFGELEERELATNGAFIRQRRS